MVKWPQSVMERSECKQGDADPRHPESSKAGQNKLTSTHGGKTYARDSAEGRRSAWTRGRTKPNLLILQDNSSRTQQPSLGGYTCWSKTHTAGSSDLLTIPSASSHLRYCEPCAHPTRPWMCPQLGQRPHGCCQVPRLCRAPPRNWAQVGPAPGASRGAPPHRGS